MAEFVGPFTVLCLEELATEFSIGCYSFKTKEGIKAFVEGRRLRENEYIVVNGPVIKKMNENLLDKKFFEGE
jgi:hypothetical protein